MARQTHWWLGCFVPWILVRNCAGCPVTRTADKPDKNRPGCLVFATLIKIEQLIKSWNHASFRPLIWWSPLHLEMQSLNHYCVTQLKLDTVEKLSSSIFCCLSVRHRCHLTKSPLFPIYTGIQALYWPNTICKGTKALFWVTHSILGLVLTLFYSNRLKPNSPCFFIDDTKTLYLSLFQMMWGPYGSWFWRKFKNYDF